VPDFRVEHLRALYYSPTSHDSGQLVFFDSVILRF